MPWSYETVRSQYWRMAYAGEREISLFSGVFLWEGRQRPGVVVSKGVPAAKSGKEMRYSTHNAIPQYPKSKKHPYETLENIKFIRYNIIDFMLLKGAYFDNSPTENLKGSNSNSL